MALTTKAVPYELIRSYPMLMIHNADVNRDDPLVALFTSEYNGIIISKNKTSQNQHIGDNVGGKFECADFEPYIGTIVLQNK